MFIIKCYLESGCKGTYFKKGMQYLKIMKYARRGESAFVRLSQIFKDYSYLSGRKILAANQVSLFFNSSHKGMQRLIMHDWVTAICRACRKPVPASMPRSFSLCWLHSISWNSPTCMFWQVGGFSIIWPIMMLISFKYLALSRFCSIFASKRI